MAGGEDKSGDFYAVLGLKKECTASELRDAYKKLALVRNPSPPSCFLLLFLSNLSFPILNFSEISFSVQKVLIFTIKLRENIEFFLDAGVEVAPRPLLGVGKLEVHRGVEEAIPGHPACLLW